MFMEHLTVYNQTVIPGLSTSHQALVTCEVGMIAALGGTKSLVKNADLILEIKTVLFFFKSPVNWS